MYYYKWDAEEELRNSNRTRNRTRNFAQILQKRLRIQMANKCQLLCISLISIIFLPLILVLRNLGQTKVVPKQIFDPFPIDNLAQMQSDLAQMGNTTKPKFLEKIAFTPNAHPLELIIANAVNRLHLKGYIGALTKKDLDRFVREKNYMAGIVFHVEDMDDLQTKLPSKLNFEVRFPPTLRTSLGRNPRFWPTGQLYPGLNELVTGKPDNRSTKDSNYGKVPPGYIQEGFIALQHAISMAYIEIAGGVSTADLPMIYMSLFPLKRYIYDQLFVVIKLLLPIAVMFSYSYSSYRMVSYMTVENELGIMKALKVKWLNWAAWFVVLFLLQSFITLLSLFILSSWGWEQDVWQYSNLMPILFFMLAYVIANITFTLMMSAVMVHHSRSAVCVLVVHLLTYLPFPLIFVLYYDLPILPKLFACLILNTGLAMGLNIILDFERTAVGLTWSRLTYPHFAGSKITLFHVMQMLMLAALIHILLLLYVESKRDASDVASKYVDVEDRPVPWYYPITTIFDWCMRRQEIKKWSHTLPKLSTNENIPLNERRTSNKDEMTQISLEALSPDADVAVYQMTQEKRRTLSKAFSADDLMERRQTLLARLNQMRTLSLEYLPASSLADASVTHSSDFKSSTSSYNVSLYDLSSHSLYPIENAELANPDEGILVLDVSKSFEGIEYLSNITMTIHPKEVTVILGQKGAGKMLLAEIIAGTVEMTSGQVVVNGKYVSEYKSEENFDQPFAMMPKHEITFKGLTIRENLYFYTYLRGMRNHRQIAREVRKYLAKLDIPHLVDMPVSQLSYGMNRCLGFCCAMCGGNHGIILDEPTLGLDEYGCHRIWDMIKVEGTHRSIIVCSHRHEEAVILADRIAVLDFGRLQCYGKTQHLLKSYCSHYYLNCKRKVHGKYGRTSQALGMMKDYLPSAIEVRLDNRKQLNVRIRDGNEIALGSLLKDLEQKKGNHGIEHFTLFRQTLRDVFIRSNETLRPLKNTNVQNMLKFEPNKGRRQLLQLRAIVIKKLIYLKFSSLLPLFLLFLFGVVIIFEISPQGTKLMHLPKMILSLCPYKTSYVLSKASADIQPNMVSHNLVASYKNYLMNNPGYCEHHDGHFKTIRGRRELIPYILRDQQMSFLAVETFYVAAVDFYPDKIICFWNPKLMHAAPISLNLLHNALLQYVTKSNATINLSNQPIEFTHLDFLNLKRLQQSTHLNMGTIPFLIFFAGVSLFILHLVYELSSGRMMLELMSGVSYEVFWGTRIIWDMLLYNIAIIAMMAIIVGNDLTKSDKLTREYTDITMVGLILLILELFGLAVLLFIYSLSFLFDNILYAYVVLLLLLVGTSLLPAVTLPGIERVLDINMPDMIQYLLYWSPSAVLFHCMRNLHILGAIKRSVQEICGKKIGFSLCQSFYVPNYFSFEYPGILIPFMVLFLLAIIYGLLFNKISQSAVFKAWIQKLHGKGAKRSVINLFRTTIFDPDVFMEKERVRDLNDEDRGKIPLVFDNVVYPDYLKGVSFSVHQREVFGIVGRFGSGKSKILEVTAGMDIIQSGDVYVYGKSVRYNRKEAFKYLGYCPKRNVLYQFMTVSELLHFYCRLSGRRRKESIDLISWLVTSLGLLDKLNVSIGNLVFANCRKLSLAVAVIASTKVIMMDEPTRGMNPEGCQQIWQMITVIHKMGRTIILAMESLEECMPLCDRICIMVNGRLQCIGTVDYLIQKFSRGCILQVYTNREYESQTDLENAHLLSSWDSNSQMGQHRRRTVNISSDSSNEPSDNDSAHTYRFQSQTFDASKLYAPPVEWEAFDFWESKAVQYHDISDFIEKELSFARLEEQYSNMLVYYIPFDMLPLSQVFSIMEVCKKFLNVSQYMVWRPSIVDMYEHFTKQNCRFWGKSSSMTKLNKLSLRPLTRLLPLSNLRKKSKFERIKGFFKRKSRVVTSV